MADRPCDHISSVKDIKQPARRECEECVKIGITLGASADLSAVRDDPVLRQLAESARDETREGERPSRDRLGGAWRAMVVLLPGRRLRRILRTP